MKTIITAAACMTVAFGTHAQSSVTLFGNLDIAGTVSKSGSGTTLPGGGVSAPSLTTHKLDSGIGPGSRFGLRGKEDLGGGLAANFWMEGGFAVDTGVQQQGGLLFGRQVFVGLQGASWQVTAGRQYTPVDIAFGTSDIAYGFFWGNPVAASGHGLYGQLGEAPGGGFFTGTSRQDNSLMVTGYFGPLTARMMAAAGNENGRGTGKFYNPSLMYASGPLKINASIARFRQGAGSITATAQPEWLSEAVVGGSYAFGPFTLSGGLFQFDGPKNTANRSAAATVGNAAASPFAFSWTKTRTAFIGIEIPMFGGRLQLSVSRQQYKYANASDSRSTTFGSLYEYPLSKRTSLYTSYGQISNDARSRTPLIATITAVSPNGFGSDPRALSVGIRHQF